VHITLQHLGVTDDQAMLFDRLASRVFGPDASCISPEDLAHNTLGQSNLWGYGISGDLPIVLVRVTEAASVPLVRQVLHAQEYWRLKGLRADAVIPAASGGIDESRTFSSGWCRSHVGPAGSTNRVGCSCFAPTVCPNRTAGCCRRRSVVLLGDRGSCPHSWIGRRPGCTRIRMSQRPPRSSIRILRRSPSDSGGDHAQRAGRLHADGREYVIVLDRERETPLPWSNVMASAEFGTMVTASGSAFTWSENSRENRLTPFANDPIEDPTGEAIYLRDEESGAVWGATPGPLPRRSDGARWLVRHGAGVTRYQHAVSGLEQELAISVAPDDPVKVAMLTLTGGPGLDVNLAYVEWCLGPPRAGERRFVVTETDEATGPFWRATPTTRSSAAAWRSGSRASGPDRSPAIEPSSWDATAR
jgi:cyclic beta-1,2-glucan synthetase